MTPVPYTIIRAMEDKRGSLLSCYPGGEGRGKKGWIHLDDESEGYDMDYKPTEYCSHHHHVSKPLKVAMFDSRELGLTRGQDLLLKPLNFVKRHVTTYHVLSSNTMDTVG